jgi:aryl-alcohol dehydrogenase-like predicted oxidoreductase
VDGKTPIEKTIEAMVELKKDGKIDYLGLCEVSTDTLRRAHKVHPITAIELEFSPFTLDIESEQTGLLRTCRELGVAVIAYSPLGRGMLTGRFNSIADFGEGDARRFLPRFSAENLAGNLKLVEDVTAFANKKKCSPGQLTLAWLLAQGDVFPIPGTTSIENLEKNVGASGVTLSAEEVTEIRKIVESAEVHGERYPVGFSPIRDTPPLS